MAAHRFYFYDRNGVELSNHPLNGCDQLGTDSGIGLDGVRLCETATGGELWRDKQGRIARVRCDGRTWKPKTDHDITLADFEGHTAILVKAWSPSYEDEHGTVDWTDWFWLIDQTGCDKIAEQTIKRVAKII